MRLARTVEEVMSRFQDRPAIGERVRIFVQDEPTLRTRLEYGPTYATKTYGEFWQRANHIAAGLQRCDGGSLHAGEKAAFLAFTSGDYAALDLACIRLGVPTIPLQMTSSDADLVGILAETEPAILAVSLQYLGTAAKLALQIPSIRRIVLFDFHPQVDEHREEFDAASDFLTRNAGPSIRPLAEIIENGMRSPEADWPPDVEDDPLAMLIYTSGSTGSPKGAMYTKSLAAAMWGGAWSHIFSKICPTSIHYMPMSHVAGHSSLKNTLARGGTCFFTAKSNLSSLLEDIALAKPNELSLVPRVCEMLYQRYHSELAKRLLQGGNEKEIEEDIITGMRGETLGGQVQWASCSSAPLSNDLKVFIEKLIGVDLHNVYGSTEAGGIWIDNKLLMPPVTDYKLVNAPELGYHHADQPHPRGELLLKTASIIPGYYKRPELSGDLFDAEGFYRTGDIVAQVGPSEFRFLDRRKNVIKLSQGEFVATAKLETLFAASPLVRNIFIYARSEWSNLLAVIVPADSALEQFEGVEGELKRLIGESLRHIGSTEKLKPYEVPRDFIIERAPFSLNNGLLSDHGKPVWPKLRARYAAELDRLHETLASKDFRTLHDIYQNRGERTIMETVQQAVRSVIGSAGIELKASDRFRDLGGDSLSAVELSLVLEEAFDTSVPVDMVISQGSDLQSIVDYITRKRADTSQRPSASSIHGAGATAYRAAQLTLEKFVHPMVLEQADALPRPVGDPHVVLLTGASGFLGRFLCQTLLRRVEKTDGKLICVVRGKDEVTAFRRLASVFEGHDGSLEAEFRRMSQRHLEVLAGDIGLPQLGLDNETWKRLSVEVDAIVHAGALVNHVLPYGRLFDANVLGTTELIELALTGRMKEFAFISSIAVAAPSSGRNAIDEDSDVRVALPSAVVDGNYASGYSTSKWAAEILLREANEKSGLPVTVFRSSMILAHSEADGQINIPDAFTRLLISLILTKIAPKSFYRTDTGTLPSKAHYDGLPVDYTSNAIATVGLGHQEGYRTYHLVNPHDDGISLDVIVGWLEQLGYPIRRVDDYQAWLEEFGHALRSLPESDQKISALPLLHGYEQPLSPVSGSLISSARFEQAVVAKQCSAGRIPSVSLPLIAKYVAGLERLGFITKTDAHEETINGQDYRFDVV